MRFNQVKILSEEKIWSEDKFDQHYCFTSVQRFVQIAFTLVHTYGHKIMIKDGRVFVVFQKKISLEEQERKI